MHFKEDYSLVNVNPAYLFGLGYLQERIHSLKFECRNKDSKEANHNLLREIVELFETQFDIHQISPQKSSLKHYASDWDLHYYDNSGWNDLKTMDFFILTFNSRRTEAQNRATYRKIHSILNGGGFNEIRYFHDEKFKNVECVVTYTASVNPEKVANDAAQFANELKDRWVKFGSITGKIKTVDNSQGYGFFKKNAKSRYLPISALDVIEIYLDEFPDEKKAFKLEYDAVFLPGTVHGCDWQIYIIYFNPDAQEGEGCFEIEVCDAEKLLKLYKDVDGNAEDFFSLLPDRFQGEWYYCNTPDENSDEYQIADFEGYLRSYHTADFIAESYSDEDEMKFIVNWAKEAVKNM